LLYLVCFCALSDHSRHFRYQGHGNSVLECGMRTKNLTRDGLKRMRVIDMKHITELN
jgi:hypothetical protein